MASESKTYDAMRWFVRHYRFALPDWNNSVARFARPTETPLFVPPLCRPAPVVLGTRWRGCGHHYKLWPANHWESSHASRGKPLAHLHGTSTNPTTGNRTISFKTLDRRGIRRSDIGPTNSLKDYRAYVKVLAVSRCWPPGAGTGWTCLCTCVRRRIVRQAIPAISPPGPRSHARSDDRSCLTRS